MANSIFDLNARPDKNRNPVVGGGLDEVFNPFTNQNALGAVASMSDMFPSQPRVGNALASGPLSDFLREREGLAQRQFQLLQALTGGGLDSASFRDFGRGFVNGYFGNDPNQAAPVARLGDIGSILQRLSQSATSGASYADNPTMAALIDKAQSAPRDFIQSILSLYQPYLDQRGLAAMANSLQSVASGFENLPVQDRNNTSFIDAVTKYLNTGRQYQAANNFVR